MCMTQEMVRDGRHPTGRGQRPWTCYKRWSVSTLYRHESEAEDIVVAGRHKKCQGTAG